MTPSTPYAHAVVLIDQHKAQIIRFNADAHHTRHLEAHTHETRQHNSDVRDSHEFHAAVCDDLAGLDEILITGGHTAQGLIKHYIEKHRPALLKHVIGYETVDHPNEAQLVALAREFFGRHERLGH